MEEQKSKVVGLNEGINQDGKPQEKISYEDLTKLFNKVLNERNYLLQQLNSFNRLDYLLQIVSLKSDLFSKEFLIKCAEEIEAALTLPDNIGKEAVEGDNKQ